MTTKTNTIVDANKLYSVEEAAKLLPQVSKSKFVGSVDMDIVLNLKEKNKKDVFRGSVNLPHRLGGDKKVIVICEEKDKSKALSAGAVKAGLEVIDEIANGMSDFDILIATPAAMPKMVKLGKVLGPKGLMPNPKNGTVTDDIEKAVASFRAGKTNFKSAQDQGTIRLKVAKVDMTPEMIAENIMAVLSAVFAETKKVNAIPFRKITVSPTMGSGIKLDVNAIMKRI